MQMSFLKKQLQRSFMSTVEEIKESQSPDNSIYNEEWVYCHGQGHFTFLYYMLDLLYKLHKRNPTVHVIKVKKILKNKINELKKILHNLDEKMESYEGDKPEYNNDEYEKDYQEYTEVYGFVCEAETFLRVLNKKYYYEKIDDDKLLLSEAKRRMLHNVDTISHEDLIEKLGITQEELDSIEDIEIE